MFVTIRRDTPNSSRAQQGDDGVDSVSAVRFYPTIESAVFQLTL